MSRAAAKWYMKSTTAVIKDKALAKPLLTKKRMNNNDIESQYYDDSDVSSDESEEEEVLSEEAKKEERRRLRRERAKARREGGEGGADAGEDDESDSEDDSDEEEEEKKKGGLGMKFLIVSFLATGGLAVGIASVGLLAVGGAFSVTLIPAILSGLAGAVYGPMAIMREKEIASLGSKRDGLNKIRGQVNELSKQNRKLTKSRKNMGKQIGRLKDCEEKLRDTVERNGASVDEFCELVEENQAIMKKMKSHFDAKVIQDCVRIIIKYDKDHDFILSSREMPMLIYALKSFDIPFEAEEFRAALTDKSVSVAIQHVTDLLTAHAEAEAKADKYGLSKPQAMEKYRKIAD